MGVRNRKIYRNIAHIILNYFTFYIIIKSTKILCNVFTDHFGHIIQTFIDSLDKNITNTVKTAFPLTDMQIRWVTQRILMKTHQSYK